MALARCLASLLLLANPALAQDSIDNASDIAAGRALAEANCAICHAVDPVGESPLSAAPAFRDIALRYAPEELEDAFNEGVPTEHPAMPDWQMTPDQARQLAAYIMSLQVAGKLKTENGAGPQPALAAAP